MARLAGLELTRALGQLEARAVHRREPAPRLGVRPVNETVRVACVQVEPVILDREATLDKLAALTAEATANGAQLVVFPETFIPAYPSSAWAKFLAGWADPRAKGAFAHARRASRSRCPAPAADRLGEIAREHERLARHRRQRARPRRGPGTLYNTLLYHAPDGSLALHHRKLVPTNHERLVWGQGDGGGLRAIETGDRPDRRPDLLGELHAARALRALRVGRRDLHRLDRRRRRRLAGDARPHRARVARVRRRARATSSAASSYPDGLPARATRSPASTSLGRGGSRDPRAGRLLPRRPALRRGGRSSTPTSTRQRLAEERQRFDPAGHYHRPDVLELTVRPLQRDSRGTGNARRRRERPPVDLAEHRQGGARRAGPRAGPRRPARRRSSSSTASRPRPTQACS